MKIRIQGLVCRRRNASSCRDFPVHVQGTLLNSRSPLLPDSHQPPRGWSRGWVIFHVELWSCVICCDSAFNAENVNFSTMERSPRQPLLSRFTMKLMSEIVFVICTLVWDEICFKICVYSIEFYYSAVRSMFSGVQSAIGLRTVRVGVPLPHENCHHLEYIHRQIQAQISVVWYINFKVNQI